MCREIAKLPTAQRWLALPLLVVLWGAMPVPATAAEPAPPARLVRWAILATPELQTTGLGDRITAALSKEASLQLVERAEIDRALAELKLSQVLSATAITDRLRLGQVVKADALLALSLEKQEDKQFIRLVICDTRSGARLRVEAHPWVPTAADKLIAAIATAVQETRARYGAAEPMLIGVTPLVSRNFTRRHNHLQVGLQRLLEQSLLNQPGVAVLEFEEAAAIRKELALVGEQQLNDRRMPLLVTGEFTTLTLAEEVAPIASGKPDEKTPALKSAEPPVTALRIVISATGAGREFQPLRKERLELTQVPRWFADEVTAALVEKPNREALNAAEQAVALERRASMFSALGDWVLAANLREAALLVQPQNDQVRLAAAHDYYCELHRPVAVPHPYGSDGKSQVISEEEWGKLVEQRMQWWHNLASHVETITRLKQVNPREATNLIDATLRSAYESFTQRDGRRRPEALDLPVVEFLKATLAQLPLLDPELHGGNLRSNLGRFRNTKAWQPPDNLPLEKRREEWVQKALYSIIRDMPRVGGNVPPNAKGGSTSTGYADKYTADTFLWFVNEVLPADYPTQPAVATTILAQPFIGGNRLTIEQLREFYARFTKSPRPFHRDCAIVGFTVFAMWHAPDGQFEERVKLVEQQLAALKKRDAVFKNEPGYQVLEQHLGFALRDGRNRLNEQKGKYVGKPGFSESKYIPPAKPAFLGQPVKFQLIDSVKPRWSDWVRCGERLDVMWSLAEVAVMREIDQPEVVFKPAKGDVVDLVRWDGRWLWIATTQGLHVVTPAGKLVARFDTENGLPEWTGNVRKRNDHFRPLPSLVIEALGQGECLVVGTHERRTWIAVASLKPGNMAGEYQPLVRVIHRATEELGLQAVEFESAEQAFRAAWMIQFPDPRRAGERCVLIGRAQFNADRQLGSKPLAVWPAKGQVEVWPAKLPGSIPYPESRVVVGEQLFISSDAGLFVYSLAKPESPPRKVTPVFSSDFELKLWNDKIIAVGYGGWTQIDPQTLSTRALHRKDFPPPHVFRQLGTSAHYGFLAWIHGDYNNQISPPILVDTLHRAVIDGREADDLRVAYPKVPAEKRSQHHAVAEKLRALGAIVGNANDGSDGCTVTLPAQWKGKRDDLLLLGELHNLVHLSLWKATLKNDDLAAIGKLKSLRALDIVDTPLTDDCLVHLNSLENLRVMHVGALGKGSKMGDAGMAHLESLPLVTLCVYGDGYTDKFAAAAARHKTLTSIRLNGTAVTHQGVAGAQAIRPGLNFNLLRTPPY